MERWTYAPPLVGNNNVFLLNLLNEDGILLVDDIEVIHVLERDITTIIGDVKI